MDLVVCGISYGIGHISAIIPTAWFKNVIPTPWIRKLVKWTMSGLCYSTIMWTVSIFSALGEHALFNGFDK